MICHECGCDDQEAPPDDLPIADVVRLCKEWKCKLCSRTPEQVQADFAAAAARNPHKSAHDWDDILNTPNAKVSGGGTPSAGLPGYATEVEK
jgi:hypothetical protein